MLLVHKEGQPQKAVDWDRIWHLFAATAQAWTSSREILSGSDRLSPLPPSLPVALGLLRCALLALDSLRCDSLHQTRGSPAIKIVVINVRLASGWTASQDFRSVLVTTLERARHGKHIKVQKALASHQANKHLDSPMDFLLVGQSRTVRTVR